TAGRLNGLQTDIPAFYRGLKIVTTLPRIIYQVPKFKRFNGRPGFTILANLKQAFLDQAVPILGLWRISKPAEFHDLPKIEADEMTSPRRRHPKAECIFIYRGRRLPPAGFTTYFQHFPSLLDEADRF